MPNWCECRLEINCRRGLRGKKAKLELNKFKAYAITKGKKETNVLDTDKFVPYPDKFKEADKKYPNESKSFNLKKDKPEDKEFFVDGMNGYDWCCRNWGTKWGICDPSIFEKDNKLIYGFQCAWSPCIPVVEKMSEMFPELVFRMSFWEGGMGYQGYIKAIQGEIVDAHDKEYNGCRGG
mgnify:CR=1 FL=1